MYSVTERGVPPLEQLEGSVPLLEQVGAEIIIEREKRLREKKLFRK
jgi:hypothetical protein